ncbi:MAG: hypothetical protein H6751_10765 [Candidatus Omnitrophica bacterium]|nr:hypothetical protein [Candidatus Omnitrophota bacterium]
MKGSRILALGILSITAFTTLPAYSEEADDSVYGFWPKNPASVNESNQWKYAVLTDRYALCVSVIDGGINAFEPLTPAESAALEEKSMDLPEALPPLKTSIWIEIGDRRYRLTQAGQDPLQPNRPAWHGLRLIEGGNQLQHFKLIHLVFTDDKGEILEGLHATLEFACWSDVVACTLHYESMTDHDMLNRHSEIRIGVDFVSDASGVCQLKSDSPQLMKVRYPKTKSRVLVKPVDQGMGFEDVQPNRGSLVYSRGSLPAYEPQAISFLMIPEEPESKGALEKVLTSAEVQIGLNEVEGEESSVRIWSRFDPTLWAHRVTIEGPNDPWENEDYQIVTTNRAVEAVDTHLLVERIAGRNQGFASITGTSAYLANSATGEPKGTPIQVSKNWHDSTDWIHAVTRLHVPPGIVRDTSLHFVFAQWEGIPAVSHAQLCLIAYLVNQQWDQVALGSFGENITYDPNFCLGRSFIDDIRPMLVTSMNPASKRWGWTVNVGGCDFLVTETKKEGEVEGNSKERNLPQASRTHYRRIGPVLSEVEYESDYLDGKVHQEATAFSWRSNDYFRAVFHLRLNVVEEVELSRLAFFQLGADRYNDNVNGSMAIGNREGLVDHWSPPLGGWSYSRARQPLTGDQQWIAFLDAKTDEPRYEHAAWPNRVMVLRDWKGTLNGDSVGPYYSVYGTDNGPTAALAEISPPPDIKILLPGDSIEAWIELAVVPQKEEDYYGENEGLKSALSKASEPGDLCLYVANSRPEKVEAIQGEFVREYLPVIECKGNQAEVQLTGGSGYYPIVFTGLDRCRSMILEQRVGEDWIPLESPEEKKFLRQTNLNPETGKWEFAYSLELFPHKALHLRLGPTHDASP